MNDAEKAALDNLIDALGGLYAHIGMVLRDESPHTGAMCWYANGKEKLIDRFAGYSLSREQALTAYESIKTLLDGK